MVVDTIIQVNPNVYRWPSICSAIFVTATFAAFSMGYLKTELNSNILKGKLFYVTLLSYSLVAQGFIPEHMLVEDPSSNCFTFSHVWSILRREISL